MNTITIGKRTLQAPAEWNELSRDQLLWVAGLFMKGITVVEFKLQLIASFLKIKKPMMQQISGENAYFMGETLNFLLQDNHLTRNLVRKINVKWLPRHYFGPDDGLKNATFGEFTKAHMAYESYKKTHESHYLDELTAVLYRKKRFLWSIRKHFTTGTDCRVRLLDHTIEKRAKKISGIDPRIKFAIYLFFDGVFGSLPDKFPNVFRKKGDSDNDNLGWASLIISLAEDRTDEQALTRVMDSKLYNVFMGLEKKARDYYQMRKHFKLEDQDE